MNSENGIADAMDELRELHERHPYMTLVRPIGWAPFLFPLLLGVMGSGLSPGQSPFTTLKTVIMLIVAYGPLLLGSVYAMNFYADVEADRQSDVKKYFVMSRQPFVTGRVSKRMGVLFISMLAILGLCLSWMINPTVFALGAVLLFVSYIYSFPPRLKGVPFADVVANTFCEGFICYGAGWSAFKDIGSINMTPSIWLILLGASAYLFTELIDIEADRRAGINTTAVFFGVNRTVKLCFWSFALSWFAYAAVLITVKTVIYILVIPFLLAMIKDYSKLVKHLSVNKAYGIAIKGGIMVNGFIIIMLALIVLHVFFGTPFVVPWSTYLFSP